MHFSPLLQMIAGTRPTPSLKGRSQAVGAQIPSSEARAITGQDHPVTAHQKLTGCLPLLTRLRGRVGLLEVFLVEVVEPGAAHEDGRGGFP